MLDGCANYLLMGGEVEHGILSRYKEKRNANREVPMSAFAEDELERLFAQDAEDKYWGQGVPPKRRKKKAKATPHVSRAVRMTELFGGGTVKAAVVDTDNVFCYGGKRFRISDAVQEYKPKQTDQGLLYDADRVYCYTEHGTDTVRFYGHSLEPLDGFITSVSADAMADAS